MSRNRHHHLKKTSPWVVDRDPNLYDEYAFDYLPPEDVSDAEDAEPSTVVLVKSPFQPEMPIDSNTAVFYY